MTLSSAAETLIASGRFGARSLMKLELGEGVFGIWNGNFDLEWNGLTYRPNQLISIDEPSHTTGMEADSLTIMMPIRADLGLTGEIVSQIQDMDYRGRLVTIYDAYFDPDTRALVHVEPMWSGYADLVEDVFSSGQPMLRATLETTALLNHRDGYRSASHEDQQLVSPGDMLFEHAARVKSESFDITLD